MQNSTTVLGIIEMRLKGICVSHFDYCDATNTLKEHGWPFNFLFPGVTATLD